MMLFLQPSTKPGGIIFPRKMGKVTYFVESSPSTAATDTIESKIKKLILRECDRVSV